MFKNLVVIASLFAVLLLFALGCINAVSYTVPQENTASGLAATPKDQASAMGLGAVPVPSR